MNKKSSGAALGIIPARYGSTRFPGKPLVAIQGKTLLQRTYENALLCKDIQEIIIATDDQRIYDHAVELGARVVMTSPDCETGSDRLVEVLEKYSEFDAMDIIVNIQGDEPCVNPEAFSKTIQLLRNDDKAVMSTIVTPFETIEEAKDPSSVKCVFDKGGKALYFSRALIPHGAEQYHMHVGIYGYRREFLLQYSKLPSSELQEAESLEQLKVLENGYAIKVAEVSTPCIGVNTPDDINKLEEYLCSQNTFS